MCEAKYEIKQGFIREVVFQVGEVEIVVVEHPCVCCFRNRMNTVIAIRQRYGRLFDNDGFQTTLTDVSVACTLWISLTNELMKTNTDGTHFNEFTDKPVCDFPQQMPLFHSVGQFLSQTNKRTSVSTTLGIHFNHSQFD